MDLGNRKELKSFAARRLEDAPQQKKIVLIYCAIVLGSSLAVTLVNFLLGLQIDQSGGLGKMGLRTTLSSVQTVLPMVQSIFIMGLDLGYLAAMLRVARGQYASPNTLRLGFDRFWPLLRLTLLKGLIFAGLGLATVYAASTIFLMTPWAKETLGILMPFITGGGSTDPMALLEAGIYDQLVGTMTPVLFIWLGLYLLIAAPIAYQYRMAAYVLIDKPALGALAAMRESRMMMRRRRFQLFRLDLGLWWYYLALAGAGVLGYADQILPMLGLTLPVSGNAAFFLTYAGYLAAQTAIYYFLRNRVEVTYALAYDAVRPQERPTNGAVLGNIFQM